MINSQNTKLDSCSTIVRHPEHNVLQLKHNGRHPKHNVIQTEHHFKQPEHNIGQL